MTPQQRAAQVLADHVLQVGHAGAVRPGNAYRQCSCGWRAVGGTDATRHRTHQAAMLVAAGLLTPDQPEPTAEAIRGALLAHDRREWLDPDDATEMTTDVLAVLADPGAFRA